MITKVKLINTMLILENVKRDNNIITANYSFPGIEGSGSFTYDIKTGKYKEVLFGDRKEPEKMYGFGHIKSLLRQMVAYDRYPERMSYGWY